jgi:hypothetical protein
MPAYKPHRYTSVAPYLIIDGVRNAGGIAWRIDDA